MDELGVDRTLMFPHPRQPSRQSACGPTPDLTPVVITLPQRVAARGNGRSNCEDRIFTAPVITLPIVEKAIEELEWVCGAWREGRC